MTVADERVLVVGPGEGRSVQLGKGLGVDFKFWGNQTEGRLAIVEHPIEARRLVPPHTHVLEDELSYVIEGTIGARIGERVMEAGPGTYVYKPRGIPHTFWNPTDQPARLMELIFPAGFENYFAELAEFISGGGRPGGPEHAAISARYEETHFQDWVPELKERYGLKLLGEP